MVGRLNLGKFLLYTVFEMIGRFDQRSGLNLSLNSLKGRLNQYQGYTSLQDMVFDRPTRFGRHNGPDLHLGMRIGRSTADTYQGRNQAGLIEHNYRQNVQEKHRYTRFGLTRIDRFLNHKLSAKIDLKYLQNSQGLSPRKKKLMMLQSWDCMYLEDMGLR